MTVRPNTRRTFAERSRPRPVSRDVTVERDTTATALTPTQQTVPHYVGQLDSGSLAHRIVSSQLQQLDELALIGYERLDHLISRRVIKTTLLLACRDVLERAEA